MGSSGFGRKWGVMGLGKRDDENRVVGWFIAGYWKLGLLEKGLREADDRGGAQRGTTVRCTARHGAVGRRRRAVAVACGVAQ
ncbi:hypothetical protein U1Q18_031799 [Sarracenia purpurea var. burkii]